MVSAKDIMVTELVTVGEDATIKEVIRILVRHKVTGLPVISDDMTLLGMVTEKDILKMLYYRDSVKSVGDLMTTDITWFDEDTDLMKIFEGLVENNFRRVPILSDGKLVGIISRGDVIRFLSEGAGKHKNTESED